MQYILSVQKSRFHYACVCVCVCVCVCACVCVIDLVLSYRHVVTYVALRIKAAYHDDMFQASPVDNTVLSSSMFSQHVTQYRMSIYK